MKSTRRSGFTLVELMVAMSIIAILIGLSAFGISTAQRNLRDNQRRDMVKSVAAGLANYYTFNSEYPTAATFQQLITTLNVPSEGVTNPSASSSTNSTQYCYAVTNDGYVLGAELEAGDNVWFNLGSATDQCEDNLAYQLAG